MNEIPLGMSLCNLETRAAYRSAAEFVDDDYRTTQRYFNYRSWLDGTYVFMGKLALAHWDDPGPPGDEGPEGEPKAPPDTEPCSTPPKTPSPHDKS